jgi:hypothetical protein
MDMEVKWLRREADYLPPSSAEVKNEWINTSTVPLCLHGMCGDSSTLCDVVHIKSVFFAIPIQSYERQNMLA